MHTYRRHYSSVCTHENTEDIKYDDHLLSPQLYFQLTWILYSTNFLRHRAYLARVSPIQDCALNKQTKYLNLKKKWNNKYPYIQSYKKLLKPNNSNSYNLK